MLIRTMAVPVVLCLLLGHTLGTAQESESEGRQVENEVSITLDSAAKEYRELICSTAADFSKRNQETAIRIARESEYVDERFNDPIRNILGKAKNPGAWDAQVIERAEQLMDICTLDAKERAELAFHCCLECDEQSDSRLRRRFLSRLAVVPDETSRLLKERMTLGEYPPQILDLVQIVGESSEEILPLVMHAAKSDDPDLGARAMDATRELIAQLERLEIEKRKAASQISLGREQLDEKMVSYATRIVARYDKNKDEELSESEYEKMLMSPKAADLDRNGRITVTEFAQWMQQRGKGR